MGAILANMMTTELVILLVSVICLAGLGYNYEPVLAALFIVGLVFPVLFYHHSWSFWLTFDYLIEGLPKVTSKQRHS
ncbi:MAG TPA: hypothetical protein VLL54_03980 [Pyrinomonadaceae bacterium]|nr:hypothetical protein [Pyrinomonadaceae bacterium]